MPFEERDNSGALFKNERKEKDTHPDYKGPCMVNGKKMEMSAWMKKSKAGKPYMSFSFREPMERNVGRDAGDGDWGDFGPSDGTPPPSNQRNRW